MTAPDLTISIVSYNAREHLRACLRALPAAVAPLETEVLVVDNGSRDGSPRVVAEELPAATLIETGANLGFARANNLALERARGRHLLLLNSDTLPEAGSLAHVSRFLDARPEYGVAAPSLLNSDRTDQGTARRFPTAAAALFGRRALLTRLAPGNRWSRRYLAGRWHQGDEPFEVDWVSGACLMVTRTAYQAVGGLDEQYFMFWEDADWCRRIKDAGFGVACVPAARVVHHEGGSRRGWPARQVWAFHQGAFRYYAKHHARHALSPLRPPVAAGLAVRAGLIIAGHRAGSLRGPRATTHTAPAGASTPTR